MKEKSSKKESNKEKAEKESRNVTAFSRVRERKAFVGSALNRGSALIFGL